MRFLMIVVVAFVALAFDGADAGPTAMQVTMTRVALDGVIDQDNDDTLAFSPDGNTVLFDRTNGPHKTIMIAQKVHGLWQKPKVASFSGKWF